MCETNFDFQTTCSYCLKKAGIDIDTVYPVYDWETDKLLGYFCKEHYIKVKSQNIIQSQTNEVKIG
ncbi:hypothetical protein MXL46_12030 [Heyndrickxia sporothermodurans]|uniref:hypothetical protein n=1 Tax=Heyndrickxia sporothermodurans TaxID=46224 RepID=UPI002DBE8FDE|nr:hypothetical protein [Heyndrickxia sporothermodurans]MEB6549815.1 hypothetical protein [Heyndrickxia sporothermodurans]MED3654719.1 hypothetical protein [Heyndrickxia sporothermodurans]